MKRRTAFFAVAIAALANTFAFAGNGNSPKVAADTYKVDAKASKITWLGKKVTGEHTGNINVADAKLVLEKGKISGGEFTIDMNSITCTDLADQTYNQKLVGHLKADDFFGTEKFPKATFVIKSAKETAANKYLIKGDATIKGITKPIEFEATTKPSGKDLVATSKIVLDRTKWDIKYGSGSFFDNLGDKAINDNFELNVSLVFKK